ncbi:MULTISPECIES: metal ABC transporter substrate-binding protein [Anaerococcus]|uniref:metal ABC transporter substrate-binding protein n=1 Tax=Anaerococcus TaxID=165779 RepID=UPI00242E6865|nr:MULTISPECIES: zinc ABC transporter substrate-binding protein [Anaerococcus]MDD7765924.1 zinc ABC transporter substrate-binding protein [Anaerococcus vaginalis]MDY6128239.1 zinc ABC transporter substrate-binding protein [Anaerococcus sp.]
MKKKILAMILVFGIFVTGCAKNNEKSNINSNNSNQTSKSENKDKETIYASFYPIYNLTKQIAGDKFNVKSFTNLNTEVHDFEPSAKDMADLSKAKVLFLNGAGLESWQEKIAESSKVEIVDTSKGINLIENTHEDEKEHDKKREDRPKSCCDAPHYHESLDEDEKEDEDIEKDEHEHEDEEEHHHHHGTYDPHVWLSPKNGIIQAKNIAEKLSEIDPENKDYYEKNFEKIKKELEEIDKEYEKKLENKENKKFLVDHEAFSYLARDYGLEQIPLTSITSTNEADAKTMKNAIDFVKKEKISAIFYEKGGSDKNVKTLADELSLDAKAINTIEYASDDDLKNEKTYQELIRENFEIMESSLK